MTENVKKPSEILRPLEQEYSDDYQRIVQKAPPSSGRRLADARNAILDMHDARLSALEAASERQGKFCKALAELIEMGDLLGPLGAAREFLAATPPAPAQPVPVASEWPKWYKDVKDPTTPLVLLQHSENRAEWIAGVGGGWSDCSNSQLGILHTYQPSSHAEAIRLIPEIAETHPLPRREAYTPLPAKAEDAGIDYDSIASEIARRASHWNSASANDPGGIWRATIAKVLRERLPAYAAHVTAAKDARIAELERKIPVPFSRAFASENDPVTIQWCGFVWVKEDAMRDRIAEFVRHCERLMVERDEARRQLEEAKGRAVPDGYWIGAGNQWWKTTILTATRLELEKCEPPHPQGDAR
jgi:hypothetical protein